MSIIHNNSNLEGLGLDTTTYNCPYCHANILQSNKQTHEARCERMNRDNPPSMEIEQEPIGRVDSSRNLPYPTDDTRRPQPRRENRRVAENKLMTCPNCETSVREQDFARHENECLGKELIPCEICNQQIPMRLYNQHAEECLMQTETRNNQRRQQEQQQQQQNQNRNQNRPGAQRQERHMSVERERPQQQAQPRPRESTSEEAPSRGFMGFLRDLIMPRDEHREEQREQPREDRNQGMRNMFSQPQPQSRQRQPTNTGMPNRSNMSDRMEIEDPRAQLNGATVVRTIERGPFGTTIVRTRVVPNQQMGQIQPRQPQQFNFPGMQGMDDMGPFGLFLNLINGGGMFGMQQMSMDDLEGQLQEQSKGLDKETIDRMSVVKYDKEKYKNVDSEAKTCPICLEEFNDGDELRFLWCMHRFHRGCVDTWLEKNSNCPICKKEFSEAEHVGTS